MHRPSFSHVTADGRPKNIFVTEELARAKAQQVTDRSVR
jgi:hypothetical protein